MILNNILTGNRGHCSLLNSKNHAPYDVGCFFSEEKSQLH